MRRTYMIIVLVVFAASSFFVTQFMLQGDRKAKAPISKTIDTLLTTQKTYQFTVKNNGAKLSSQGHWFSVSNAGKNKTPWLQWLSRTLGFTSEHVFELIVQKSKGKTAWSQIIIFYTVDKKREKYIYRFHTRTGKIKPVGKVKPHMMRAEDLGESWQIIGYAHVPEGATHMEMRLYPVLGKKAHGTLKIKKFNLSEPS